MKRPPLRVVGPRDERLGLPTIMDPTLASKHGVPYVRLAAFSIDVDRVRDWYEERMRADELPFAWEVFLTEVYVLEHFDPEKETDRALIEDASLSVLDLEDATGIFGAQLPFAVFDAVKRGAWPSVFDALFQQWRKQPEDMQKDLAPLWAEAERQARALAHKCLRTQLTPACAPPTIDALRALAGEDDAA